MDGRFGQKQMLNGLVFRLAFWRLSDICGDILYGIYTGCKKGFEGQMRFTDGVLWPYPLKLDSVLGVRFPHGIWDGGGDLGCRSWTGFRGDGVVMPGSGACGGFCRVSMY